MAHSNMVALLYPISSYRYDAGMELGVFDVRSSERLRHEIEPPAGFKVPTLEGWLRAAKTHVTNNPPGGVQASLLIPV